MLSVPIALGAFVAGVLMFLAPCTLPIVPGYLAFISGIGNDQVKKIAGTRRQVVRNAVAFVLGFSVVFILLGASAGLFGLVIGSWRYVLARLGGLVIALFGVVMLGWVRLPVLSAERHIKLPSFIKVGNPASSALIGGLFALGWSPCIGPILGTILFTAAASATAAQGALLLAIFSAGLGLPFILMALMLARAEGATARLGRFAQMLSTIGGMFLVAIGLLIFFNLAGLLVSWGFAISGGLYDRLLNYM